MAWQSRAGQGRFQHVPAPLHTPPRGTRTTIEHQRGEERCSGLVYLNATQRMYAFWWRLAFLLVMDAPEDRIGYASTYLLRLTNADVAA
jgi:hypothetical protein